MVRRCPELCFRRFRAADVTVVGPWLRQAGFDLPARIDPDVWGRRLERDPRIVCEAALDPAGVVAGFYRLDLAPDRSAEITLIVDPGRRGLGIGSAVLATALASARRLGLRRLLAVVQTENTAAEAFFRDAGFENAGVYLPGFVHLARIVHRADRQPPIEISP
jgi:ribosomal protein S18 acetylase RimI-like enzyme